MKKIIIAGGTGFIGSYIANSYHRIGYDVTIISRHASSSRKIKHIRWNSKDILNAIEGSDILLNLCGKSVDCRYHEKNKQEIFNSRIETTMLLSELVEECYLPPKLWINMSTATIYRHSENTPMTEEDGELGAGFSEGVAKAWENAFFEDEHRKTRKVALRTAIVLGQDGGVITPFKNLVKYGLGGPQGPGTQMVSWIHIEDLFQIIRFIERSVYLDGIFNCSAPNPVTNKEFMRVFRRVMNVNFKLSQPEWLLEFGAYLIRTETELLLKSRYVIPKRLTDYGFKFTYPFLIETLEQIIHNQDIEHADIFTH